MKVLLVLFLALSSFSLLAVDFRSFEDYKKNNALLSSDIERLETLESAAHNEIYVEAIKQYKMLFLSYEKINSPLTLTTFVKDATDNGWKLTAAKAKNLVSVCETKGSDHLQCLAELKQLKSFVSESNLGSESKESINLFVDNYMAESTQLSVFDETFISGFNELTSSINKLVTPVITQPAMTIKITPTKMRAPVMAFTKKVIAKKSNQDYFYFAGAFGFFVFALSFYKRKKKLNSLKSFYGRIFKTARGHNFKIKLFGYVNMSGLTLIAPIEKSYLETIKTFQTYAQEAQVKFKTSKKMVKIDTSFTKNRSLQEFAALEAGTSLKEKLESLQQAVNACGGEFLYSSQFNTKGEITNSNLSITLPGN